jgi:tetratricopeptide (TPR) repeat protein
MGNIYYQFAYGEKPSKSILLKNAGFLAKNIPFASKKAEGYFNKAVENAKQFGAKGFEGMAYLSLGLLHKTKKRKAQAKKCLSDAINTFEECGAKVYLEQAREALKSL